MDISCCYFYTQHESSAVTDCMGFLGKLSFVFSFYEHPAIRVCCGYCLFHGFLRSSTSLWRILLIILNWVVWKFFDSLSRAGS